ncbi:hypothetical protein C9Z53_21365 [Escherichia coli]|nr:hypothetical protein C9323_21385 [Escherichia coli]TJA50243.1 hypothetical protein C9312_21485 [Escherichia coli]TJH34263.1 hypothetical protein C9156_21830 [Escherichia coli]TJH62074.1 hypothetical protein C9149_21190 [Escherichia coli]TJH72769.1 hypothetical protein C9150_21290 [Escherichia coli]
MPFYFRKECPLNSGYLNVHCFLSTLLYVKVIFFFCMLVQYNNFQTYKSDYSENMFKTFQSS